MPEDKDSKSEQQPDEVSEEPEEGEPEESTEEVAETSGAEEESPGDESQPSEAEAEPAEKPQKKRSRRPRRSTPKALEERTFTDPRYREMVAPVDEPLHVRVAPVVAILGLGVLLAAFFLYSIAGKPGKPTWVCLAVGGAFLAFALIASFQKLVMYAGMRGARVGAHTLILSVLFLAALVMLNWFLTGWEVRWDFTKEKVNSLAPQTVKIVRDLGKGARKDKMKITAFLTPNYYGGEKLRKLLKLYARANKKYLVVDIVDPNLAGTRVKAIEDKTGKHITDGTVLVEYGDVVKEASNPDERRLTSLILSATKTEKPRIYFLEGHGEAGLDEWGEGGLSKVKSALEGQNYQPEALNLVKEKEPKIPEACKVLVIAGAKQPLFDKELKAVQDWVADNGRLLLLLAEPPAPDFSDLLSEYGARVAPGIIVNPTGSTLLGNALVTYIIRSGDMHDITRGLYSLAFPAARAIIPETSEPDEMEDPYRPKPPTGPARAILKTDEGSWAETDIADWPPSRDGSEESGPLSIAVAIEKTTGVPEDIPLEPEKKQNQPKIRIVAIGSAAFAYNDIIRQLPMNLDLFLNSIHWLAEETELIDITAKDTTPKTMTLSGGQKRFIAFLTCAIIPLAIIAAGIAVWWRRR